MTDKDYLFYWRLRGHMRAALADGEAGRSGAALRVLEADITARLARYEYEQKDYERPGTWRATPAGRRFWILDPRPGEVDVNDLLYLLPRIPRFNGGTRGRPYSVAQHSVLVSREVDQRFALHGLLHDAHEAYVQDVISPLKAVIGTEYGVIEHRLKGAVADRFGIEWTPEAEREVKRADNAVLAAEFRDLTAIGYGPDQPEPPIPETIVPQREKAARRAFGDRLRELTGPRLGARTGALPTHA